MAGHQYSDLWEEMFSVGKDLIKADIPFALVSSFDEELISPISSIKKLDDLLAGDWADTSDKIPGVALAVKLGKKRGDLMAYRIKAPKGKRWGKPDFANTLVFNRRTRKRAWALCRVGASPPPKIVGASRLTSGYLLVPPGWDSEVNRIVWLNSPGDPRYRVRTASASLVKPRSVLVLKGGDLKYENTHKTNNTNKTSKTQKTGIPPKGRQEVEKKDKPKKKKASRSTESKPNYAPPSVLVLKKVYLHTPTVSRRLAKWLNLPAGQIVQDDDGYFNFVPAKPIKGVTVWSFGELHYLSCVGKKPMHTIEVKPDKWIPRPGLSRGLQGLWRLKLLVDSGELAPAPFKRSEARLVPWDEGILRLVDYYLSVKYHHPDEELNKPVNMTASALYDFQVRNKKTGKPAYTASQIDNGLRRFRKMALISRVGKADDGWQNLYVRN